MKRKLYQAIASAVMARETQEARGADTSTWTRYADGLARHFLPSGSGIDCGTKIDWARTSSARLVFIAPFHHMNENGMYDGWTDHAVFVTPSLAWDIEIRITGRDRNHVKEYIAGLFEYALTRDGEETATAPHGWREEAIPAAPSEKENCVRCGGRGKDPGYTPLPGDTCCHCGGNGKRPTCEDCASSAYASRVRVKSAEEDTFAFLCTQCCDKRKAAGADLQNA